MGEDGGDGEKEGATVFMVVLAAFQLMLSRYADNGKWWSGPL